MLHGLVVALPLDGQPVLGSGELVHQALERLVRLQLRIRLDDGEQPPERARESRLRLREAAHRLRTARRAGGALRRLHGAGAGRDHRVERLTLVRHVALRRLDEIRNEVIASLELHVDLRERVAEPVAHGDEAVVRRDHPDDERGDDGEEDPPTDAHSSVLLERERRLPLSTLAWCPFVLRSRRGS